MYFNKFPKIDYKFSNNQTLPVVDIFRKVSFSQESLQNSNIFINIVNGEGKKAEILAYEYYSNPEFSWLLFMANQTVNPSLDWPVDYDTFKLNLNSRYSGFVYYTVNINKLQEGDIIMSAIITTPSGVPDISSIDVTTYGMITSINRELRYFHSIDFINSMSPSSQAIILRLNSNGKYRPVEDENGILIVVKILKREPYITAPKYFKYGPLIISPYRIFDGSGLTDATASPVTTGIYVPTATSDPNTLFNTIIYSYMLFNPIPSGVVKVSIQEDEFAIQNAKYNIKVIKPELISDIIDLFDKTINSNSIGRAQQIELFI